MIVNHNEHTHSDGLTAGSTDCLSDDPQHFDYQYASHTHTNSLSHIHTDLMLIHWLLAKPDAENVDQPLRLSTAAQTHGCESKNSRT